MTQTGKYGLTFSQLIPVASTLKPLPFHQRLQARREILFSISWGKVPCQVSQVWNEHPEAEETPSLEWFKCILMQLWAAWFNLDDGSALSKCWIRELTDTPSSLQYFVVLWPGNFWLPVACLSLIPCLRIYFRGKRFLNLLQLDIQPFLRKIPVFGHFA